MLNLSFQVQSENFLSPGGVKDIGTGVMQGTKHRQNKLLNMFAQHDCPSCAALEVEMIVTSRQYPLKALGHENWNGMIPTEQSL
ncbi:hypothetical protein [Alteromonas halophila]|uniref:Uncharacterized protein n=1 Tax=Alteromonas halophila TaxID=516698 RepID=A0A918JNZ5_9ALTE|nr:hypothetical protein [Alteromonas halophila]GGW90079.1 hypothetical protein GCM10007391_25570 [Alteromonas halophila]